jgi:hypothetical protein
MSEAGKSNRALPQPFTFGGVAALAEGRLGRLWLAQLLFAFVGAAGVMIAAHASWWPVIREAIRALPDTAAVHNGQLQWAGPGQMLAANRHFAVAVNTDESAVTGQTADLQLVLVGNRFKVSSLLGYLDFAYPASGFIALNRQALEPWWGAWSPAVLVGLGATAGLALIASWWALACLYSPCARLIAFFLDREMSWRVARRLAAASLLPGALVMTGGVVLYAFGQLPLVGLGFAFALHLVTGWIFLFGSPWFLPRQGAAAGAVNPFATSQPTKTDQAGNPFAAKPSPPEDTSGLSGGPPRAPE